MSQTADTMRPKLIGGLVGAGIATSFCIISTLTQLIPPRSAVPDPVKTIPLTALYAYLAYCNARAFGRTYRLINQQPAATPTQAYNQLAALHWNFALTGTAYTARALVPEVQIVPALIDSVFTAGFVAGAYNCKKKANAPKAA